MVMSVLAYLWLTSTDTLAVLVSLVLVLFGMYVLRDTFKNT